CLVLLQYADDLFVCETIALHPLVLSMGQSLLQNGLFQRGKVNADHVCIDEILVFAVRGFHVLSIWDLVSV
ncbi:hypothetical protein, partial [Rhizobium leguminosarum]|uniref:hypothetical protein n=1 Tax=Rhizobium leguminosarum TaxID=384 RepID=UPI00197F0208